MDILESFIGEIKSVKSIQCFPMLFDLIKSRFGYQYYGFAIYCPLAIHTDIPAGIPNNKPILVGDAPLQVRTWLDDRLSIGKFCSGRFTPALFSEVISGEGVPSPRITDESNREMTDGVVVPLFGRGGDYGCIVLGIKSSRLAPREFAEKIGWYWMILGGYLYEAYLHCAANSHAVITLTSRERECLAWAAEGKTSWEIGQIIGVAERTVNFHLNNCLRKTGSSKRQHAVSRCLQSGAIV